MIDYPCFFVAFKAVEKLVFSVSAHKFGKACGFGCFDKQPLFAVAFAALIAGSYALCDTAFSVFAPLRVLAPVKLHKAVFAATLAFHVLAA